MNVLICVRNRIRVLYAACMSIYLWLFRRPHNVYSRGSILISPQTYLTYTSSMRLMCESLGPRVDHHQPFDCICSTVFNWKLALRCTCLLKARYNERSDGPSACAALTTTVPCLGHVCLYDFQFRWTLRLAVWKAAFVRRLFVVDDDVQTGRRRIMLTRSVGQCQRHHQ